MHRGSKGRGRVGDRGGGISREGGRGGGNMLRGLCRNQNVGKAREGNNDSSRRGGRVGSKGRGAFVSTVKSKSFR